MDKRTQLLALARKRQLTRRPGYAGIGDFHGGIYECEFVSPYTKSAGNVDAAVMVLLQDWSSADRLAGPVDEVARELGYTPGLPTNRNLARLLQVHFGLALRDTYASNLFPFVKPGDLSTRIPAADLLWAAQEFALPQIAIVQPRLVVCLGLASFNALRGARGLKRTTSLEDGIASPFELDDAQVWCQAHTGALGRANRNRQGADRVSDDWSQMAAVSRGRLHS